MLNLSSGCATAKIERERLELLAALVRVLDRVEWQKWLALTPEEFDAAFLEWCARGMLD